MTIHYERGLLLFDLRRFPEAETEFALAVYEEPEFALAWAMLAAAQNNQRLFQKARISVETALGLDPNLAYSYYLLSHVQLGEGRVDQAELALEDAQRIDPHNPEYFAFRARICLAREESWQAADWAKKGLANDPEHVSCLESLIESLFELELFDEAEKIVRNLLAVAPERGEVHRRKGLLDFRKGRMEAALEAFRYSASQNPLSGDSLRTTEWFARPSDGRIAKFLKSTPHVLHLSTAVQFGLMLLPAICYLSVLTFSPNWKLAWILSAAWASISIAAFGVAFVCPIFLELLYCIPSRHTFLGDSPDGSRMSLPHQMYTWIMVVLGVICILYMYFFLVLSPFLIRYVGAGTMIGLTAILGYRATKDQLVRAAYTSPPKSGLLLRYLQNISFANLRIISVCSILAGMICTVFWVRFDYKPTTPREKRRPPDRGWQVEVSSGEMVDETGKRHEMGNAFRRLYGLSEKQPDSRKQVKSSPVATDLKVPDTTNSLSAEDPDQ